MNTRRTNASKATKQVGDVNKMLSVPTALSILLQVCLPAAASARHDNDFQQRRGGNEGRQLNRELRQLARINGELNRITRFDLQSAKDVVNLTAADLNGANSIQLMLGGMNQTFQAGDRVSAAEYVAIKGGAGNNLSLDAKGRADAGSFSLNSLGGSLADLNVSKFVVPKNVTALGDFSNTSDFNFNGDLVNKGSIYGFSSDAANQSGSFSADNIFNRGGASISSNLPNAAALNAIDNFSLELNAVNDIVNSGNITSNGSLTLSAGRSITNAHVSGDGGGATPLIQASHNVNLNSALINNAGTIASLNNDINVSAAAASTAIYIDGDGGTFDATRGNINVRSSTDLDAGDVTIVGGDYLSEKINIYAYEGEVFNNVNSLTGQLNTQANVAHVIAATDTLVLGDSCITGDPAFVNTNGDILINGKLVWTDNLALVASGNILCTNGSQISMSSNTALSQRALTLIAGAKVTTTGVQTPNQPATADIIVNLDPAQAGGGNIDLSNGNQSVINADTQFGQSAFNSTLAAVASSSGNGGKVLLGSNNIDTRDVRAGGSVTIIAGANPSVVENTITVGNINTNTVQSLGKNGGAITLLTQQPVSSTSNTLVIGADGAIKSGDLKGSGTTQNNAAITITGNLTTGDQGQSFSGSGCDAGAITIDAGASVGVQNLLANGSFTPAGNTADKGGNGGAISVTSKNGNITVGQVNASGGKGGGRPPNDPDGSPGGTAGAITLSAANGTVAIASANAASGGPGGQPADVKINANHGIAITGSTVGNTAQFTTTSNTTGDVNLGASVTATGAINISTVHGSLLIPTSASLSGGYLSFNSQTGSFGTAATRINANVSKIAVNTGTSGTSTFFAKFNGNVGIDTANIGANGTFDITSGGSISTLGVITALNTKLVTTGVASGISASTATRNLTFSVPGNGTAVTINNTGELFVNDSSGPARVSIGTTAGGVSNPGLLHIAGNISGSDVVLTASAPQGQTSGIVQDNLAARVFASVKLTLNDNGAGAGNIGSQASPILTKTPNLSVFARDDAFVSNLGNVVLSNSTVGNSAGSNSIFSLVTTTDTNNRQGSIVIGDRQNISVLGTNGNAGTTLSLQSSEFAGPGGTGGIIASATSGVLTAGTVVLKDNPNGNGTFSIGGPATPIRLATSKIVASTNADITLTNIGNLTDIEATAGATSGFSLDTAGSIGEVGTHINAARIALKASGDIGTQSTPLLLNAALLTINSGGSAFVSTSTTNPVTLQATTTFKNGAVNTYSVSAPNSTNLVNVDPLTAKSVILSSTTISGAAAITATETVSLIATTGNVSMAKSIKAPNILLSAVGPSKTIVQSPGAIIEATKLLTLSLSDGVASLQTQDNKISGLATNISGSGQVLLKTVSPMTMSSLSGNTQILNILYTGSLTIGKGIGATVHQMTIAPNTGTGKVTDNSVSILMPVTANQLSTFEASGTGTISIDGSLIGTGDKILKSNTGTININAPLSGNQITMTTNGGDIRQTAAGVITAPGGLILNLNNAGTVVLSAANNAFTVFRDNVVGAGFVDLKTTGTLVLDQVVGNLQKLTATAGDTIVTPNVIQAQLLSLTANGPGGIASSGQRLMTNASQLGLNATAAGGNVFATVTGTGPVTLLRSSAGATFDLMTGGAITTTGTLIAQTVTVHSGGTSGIKLGAAVGGATSNQVTLVAGSGGISSSVSSASIQANSIALTSTGGSIFGTSASDGLNINASNVQATATGTGSVNLESVGTNPLTLLSSSAGRSFKLSAKSALSIQGVTTNAPVSSTLGDVTITTNVGGINVSNGATITANGGNLLISALQSTAVINIGQNAQLMASSTAASDGNVTINTGTLTTQTGPTPANVIVNASGGGQVFFGTASITANPPNNTLNAKGRKIVFSGNTAASIVLGGGVTITADPPEAFSLTAPVFASPVVANEGRLSLVSETATLTGAPSISSAGNVNQERLSIATPEPVSTNYAVNFAELSSASIPAKLDGLNDGVISSATTAVDQLGKTGLFSLFACENMSYACSDDVSGIIEADTFNESQGLKAERGNMLISPTVATAVVDTRFGALRVAPHSMVLAMAVPNGLAIYNLDDRQRDAVTLEHNGTKFAVAPGQHLFITERSGVEFHEVNVNENILYAGVQKTKLSNGNHVFNAQFSLPSAINVVRPLRRLVVSKDAESVSKAKRLLKTTAVLMHLKGTSTNYQQYLRPRTTAWTN